MKSKKGNKKDEQIDDIAAHYRSLFQKYGDSPQAAQWRDLETQERRFAILAEIGNVNDCSILDFGCGTGQLAAYFNKRGLNVRYTGVDIVDELIEYAGQKYPQHRFCRFDNIHDETFDFVFISGCFNNLMQDNRGYYQDTIRRCFSITAKGLCFNMLSRYVDYEDSDLFYESPEIVLTFLKENISPFVTLRHDYQIKEGIIPFEFTVYVYRNGTNFAQE